MEQEQITVNELKREVMNLKKDIEELKLIKEEFEFIKGTREGWDEYDKGEFVEMDSEDFLKEIKKW